MAFLWLTCGMIFGCTSFKYGKALESGERPWGRCGIEMISESGERLKGRLMNLYLLKREAEKEAGLKTPKIWLEGHIQTIDFDDDVWTIDFNGEKEKFTGTKEIDGEKKTVTASLCTNQIKNFGGGKNSSYKFNLTPTSIFACNDTDPQIFPEFRVLLLNSKGRWFRLDLKCELNISEN